MHTFCNFTSKGRECLGSTAWFQLDARNRLRTQIQNCRRQMERLKQVAPHYDGFRIIRAENLRGKDEKVIYTE